MNAEHIVIAVDGGNSKTDVALVSTAGTVLSLVRGGGSSPHQLGLDHAVGVVGDLVDRAWFEATLAPRGTGRALAAAVFMAGADLPAEETALAGAVQDQQWADVSQVANDVYALLWAATGQGVGVAVTVGAGVNCVGRSPDGRQAWFPALGAITGDWGGGPDIGLAALGAAIRGEDRRGPVTSLGSVAAQHFDCSTALDVAIAVHQGRIAQSRLMELAPLVVQEANAGDGEAMRILERQADEVAVLALAAMSQLELTGGSVDVVLGGGVLVAIAPLVVDRVRATVAATARNARVIVCSVRPVVGSALAGLALAGVDGAATERLREGFRER